MAVKVRRNHALSILLEPDVEEEDNQVIDPWEMGPQKFPEIPSLLNQSLGSDKEKSRKKIVQRELMKAGNLGLSPGAVVVRKEEKPWERVETDNWGFLLSLESDFENEQTAIFRPCRVKWTVRGGVIIQRHEVDDLYVIMSPPTWPELSKRAHYEPRRNVH